MSDLAINGKVLVVDTQGKLIEFVRNKVATTKLQLPLIDGLAYLAASDKAPTTVIGSGRLLFLLDANYNLARTIFLATDEKITSVALTPDGKNLWLTLGKNLFSFNLP